MLETLLKFSPNSINFNHEDIDGSTPLHCAVISHSCEAVNWLIDHGAKVDAEDFTMTTPLQIAARLRNFRILCLLISKVSKTKMKASDFQHATPTFGRYQIMLSRDEKGANTIKFMDYQAAIHHFNALSYPLEFSTTSLEARNRECIATVPLEQSILIFHRETIPDRTMFMDNSPDGVHYRWWRKTKPEARTSQINSDKWIWRVQLNTLPSPAAVRQPHQNECFLECRVVLPAHMLRQSCTHMSPDDIMPSKHVISWIMVKIANDKAEPREEQQSLGSKIFFSTLEYAEIPRSPAELFGYCLQQLEQEWISICDVAELHLTQMVGKTAG
jgi:hypothetical protein